MSTSVKLPHGTWVLVADGRKALLLANEGDAAYPDFRVSRLFESPPNPRTSAQGTDRPGRKFFARRRSAVGQTDWHRLAEAQFAGTIVDALFTGPLPAALILAAPPAFLAELRKQLPKQAKSHRARRDRQGLHPPAGRRNRTAGARLAISGRSALSATGHSRQERSWQAPLLHSSGCLPRRRTSSPAIPPSPLTMVSGRADGARTPALPGLAAPRA